MPGTKNRELRHITRQNSIAEPQTRTPAVQSDRPSTARHTVRDPIELEIFKNIFHSIAEEMGAALRRTAFSPNIKERRDYSCAIFDRNGQVVAMGDHMPVHLGSMPMSVRAAIDRVPMYAGDVVMLNDPFCGGTHLPDITLVAPVYAALPGQLKRRIAAQKISKPSTSFVLPSEEAQSRPDFYVASRAHHADVGGTYPGSMGLCTEIYQEGVRIPPVKLVRAGSMDNEVLQMFLRNVRTPEERWGDLEAQLAACHTGALRLQEMCGRYGKPKMRRAMEEMQQYSEEMMRAFLKLAPKGSYRSEDFLDDDGIRSGRIRIAATITFHAEKTYLTRNQSKVRGGQGNSAPLVTVDFSGTEAQVPGSVNAVEAVTYSVCFYVFRSLLNDEVPATSGLMRPIEVIAPRGTVVNAQAPAAVAGGNVETSQRIVDVLLRALSQALPQRIPAASSGTMNNLTIGGSFPVNHPRAGESFAYYETIAGGMGARPGKDGISGVHTHMTNSLNTPAEALEYAYPLRVTEYSFRAASGGRGRFRGGDGIVREIEMLSAARVTMLADRRSLGPYGLHGGSAGAKGQTVVIRKNGRRRTLAGKFSLELQPGDRIRVLSPGGGGWGRPTSRKSSC